MKNALAQLPGEITSRPALENDFYRRWMSGSFSIEELEIFARNYEAWVKSFPDAHMSFGAQLALEWQAYTMLRKLYDGARNYLPLWSNPDEFHEACGYFYTHIGAAEKDHKEESLKAVQRYARDDESLAWIVEGYQRHLKLISDFWLGLYNVVMELPREIQCLDCRGLKTF